MTAFSVMDIVSSMGMEIAIFCLTLGFAFLIRGFPGKQAGNQKSVSEIYAPTKNTGRSSTPPPPSGPSRVRATAKGGDFGQGPRSGLGAQQPGGGAQPQGRRGNSGNRGPSQMVDDIVDGMKDQQSLKFATKALTLYDDFKAAVRQENLNLPEVMRHSRHPAIEFYTTLVHCAVRAGKHHQVMTFIEDMIEHGISRSLIFYESTMKQLAGQKQYQLALAVYDRLAADGLEPSAVTCSCLIGFAAEVGEFQRAVTFFERLSKITTPSIRACMTVLRVHAKRQDWGASVETLRHMQRRGVVLDSLALNVTLATGIAADQLEAVHELVEEGNTYQPPISDVVSYNTLIKGCAQRGDADRAVEAIKLMRAQGLKPNAITYNTSMDAAVRDRRTELAWGLMKEMRETLRPDKFTCSILIKGLGKHPRTDHVLAALDLLVEVDGSLDITLKSTLYHTVLDAANTQGSEAQTLAAKVFAQMRQHRVAPTPAAQRLLVQGLPNGAGKQS